MTSAEILTEFRDALAARGLPATASLADLIRHERGQMGLTVAASLLADLYTEANRREAEGDIEGATALREFAATGPKGAEDA